MRRLGLAMTAAVALLLGKSSFAPAAGNPPAVVVVEEPADLPADASSVVSPDVQRSSRVTAASPPAAPQPVWPLVLIAASVFGMSVMALKAR